MGVVFTLLVFLWAVPVGFLGSLENLAGLPGIGGPFAVLVANVPPTILGILVLEDLTMAVYLPIFTALLATTGAAATVRSIVVALAVVAVVLGVRALVAARRAKLRGLLVVAVSAGIGFAMMILVVFTSVVALWPLQYELQECQRQALTVSAQHACGSAFEQGVTDRVERLLGTTD